MSRYKLISNTENTLTYQYNPLYMWAAIVTGILAVIGYFSEIKVIQIIVLVMVVTHFIMKLFDKNQNYKKIREAEKSGKSKASGSPLSFSNPLRVEIEKT